MLLVLHERALLAAIGAIGGCNHADSPAVGAEDDTDDADDADEPSTWIDDGPPARDMAEPGPLDLERLEHFTSCGSLFKVGWTLTEPTLLLIAYVPIPYQGIPGEYPVERSYDFSSDTQAELWLEVGATLDTGDPICANDGDFPADGKLYKAVEGYMDARYSGPGCIFTCDQLHVEISNVLFDSQSDREWLEVDAFVFGSG